VHPEETESLLPESLLPSDL